MLELKEGKFYVNARGCVVGPLQKREDPYYPWTYDDGFRIFRSDGTNCLNPKEDLKEEYVDAAKFVLSDTTIDQIVVESLQHQLKSCDIEPLEYEALKIVLRMYGITS